MLLKVYLLLCGPGIQTREEKRKWRVLNDCFYYCRSEVSPVNVHVFMHGFHHCHVFPIESYPCYACKVLLLSISVHLEQNLGN